MLDQDRADMTNNTYTIDAVLFEREHECWVAQCLQYDIGAQAGSFKDLMYELEKALVGHVVICREHEAEPFADLSAAPEEYWRMFEEGFNVDAREDVASFRMPHPAAQPKVRRRIAA